LAHFQQATGLLEGLAAALPDDMALRRQLAFHYQTLGDLQGHSGLQNLGSPTDALASYRKALGLYMEVIGVDAGDRAARRGVALLQIRMGDLEEFRDDLDAALASYRSALEISEKLAAENSTSAEDLRRLALAHRKVGGIAEDLADYTTALAEYDKAS